VADEEEVVGVLADDDLVLLVEPEVPELVELDVFEVLDPVEAVRLVVDVDVPVVVGDTDAVVEDPAVVLGDAAVLGEAVVLGVVAGEDFVPDEAGTVWAVAADVVPGISLDTMRPTNAAAPTDRTVIERDARRARSSALVRRASAWRDAAGWRSCPGRPGLGPVDPCRRSGVMPCMSPCQSRRSRTVS